MARRRFYAPPQAFTAHADGRVRRVTLAPEETRHLRDVLRLKAGAEVYVFDGEGREYLCTVTEIGRGPGGAPERGPRATLEVGAAVSPPCPESPLSVALWLALLKGEKFDLVVQKATELGVVRIVPVATRRADVRLSRDERGSDGARRVARWQRLALEAAKQSGRARVPVICAPVSFAAALKGASETNAGETLRLLFAERAGARLIETFGEAAGGAVRKPLAVTALVGPEGGWEDEELREAAAAGWRIITLGGRTLRAETAAITVVALLQHRFGDLS